MKALLITSAGIELGAGLALLCCPSPTVRFLVGAPLETPVELTVVRVGGAGLLALGLACWFGRLDSKSRAAKGLVAAMLLYNAATAAILAFAGISLGLHGRGLWPAMVIHTAMTSWCATYLLRADKGQGKA